MWLGPDVYLYRDDPVYHRRPYGLKSEGQSADLNTDEPLHRVGGRVVLPAGHKRRLRQVAAGSCQVLPSGGRYSGAMRRNHGRGGQPVAHQRFTNGSRM